MPIWIDKVTRQRIPYQKECTDLEYDLSGDEAISQESLPLIGAWSDFTGSGGVDSRSQQLFAGTENQLFGTDPGVQGEKIPKLNVVGETQNTHRRRTIKRYIDLKKC
jgi:hypothetical protein